MRRTVAGSEAAFPTPCRVVFPSVRLWRPLPVRKSIGTERGKRTAKSLGSGGLPASQPTGPALSRPHAYAVESIIQRTISDRSTLFET